MTENTGNGLHPNLDSHLFIEELLCILMVCLTGQPPDLARLIQERDELMRTGNYAADDKLVRRLNSEIERIAQLRGRPF